MSMRSKPAVLVGLGLISLSALSYRQLEIHSFNSTTDFEFRFLEHTWFPVHVAGLVLSAIGFFLFGCGASPKNALSLRSSRYRRAGNDRPVSPQCHQRAYVDRYFPG